MIAWKYQPQANWEQRQAKMAPYSQARLTHAVLPVGCELEAILAEAVEGAGCVKALAKSAHLPHQSGALIHICRGGVGRWGHPQPGGSEPPSHFRPQQS